MNAYKLDRNDYFQFNKKDFCYDLMNALKEFKTFNELNKFLSINFDHFNSLNIELIEGNNDQMVLQYQCEQEDIYLIGDYDTATGKMDIAISYWNDDNTSYEEYCQFVQKFNIG